MGLIPGGWVGWWVIIVTLAVFPGTLDPFWLPKWWAFCVGALLILSTQRAAVSLNPSKGLMALSAYISASFMIRIFWGILSMEPGTQRISWDIGGWMAGMTAIFAVLLAQHLISTGTPQMFTNLAGALCIAAGLIGFMAILQRIGLNQWLIEPQSSRNASSMFSMLGNVMLTGNFLAIIAPLFLMFKRWWGGFIFCAIVVVLAGNNAGMLALAVSATIWLFMKRSKWAWAMLLALGAIIGLGAAYLEDGGRFIMWKDVWEYFVAKHHPYTGYGIGSLNTLFRQEVFRQMSHPFHHPHNEYLALTFEMGIIGITIVIGTIIALIRRIFNSPRTILLSGFTASFGAILTICMFSYPLYVAPLGLACLIVYSALENLTLGGYKSYVSA